MHYVTWEFHCLCRCLIICQLGSLQIIFEVFSCFVLFSPALRKTYKYLLTHCVKFARPDVCCDCICYGTSFSSILGKLKMFCKELLFQHRTQFGFSFIPHPFRFAGFRRNSRRDFISNCIRLKTITSIFRCPFTSLFFFLMVFFDDPHPFYSKGFLGACSDFIL